MSKDKISDYSATANSNTDIGGINIDEGCAPSGINDAIRTLMKQLKDWQSGSQDVYIHPAGSASVPSITATGDTNTGIFFPAADTVGISTGGTERARIDSSGNLGLGVTPSAWSSIFKVIDFSTTASLVGSSGGANLFNNAYYNGSDYIYKTTAAATRYLQSSGAHQWYNAASGTAGNAISFTQAMTLDASGKLLVGATSSIGSCNAQFTDSNGQAALFNSSSASGAYVGWYNSGSARGFIGSAAQLIGAASANNFAVRTEGDLLFATGSTERARIDSSGNLLVGKTSTSQSAGGSVLYGGGTNGAYFTGVASQAVYVNRETSDGTVIDIRRSASTVGTISVTTSSTAYNTSSDYRLKHDISPMTGALAKVAALKPCKYKWNADGSDGEGFIAHELAEVVPHAVTGAKDAVDEDGNPVYQGIDTSFLVATLTAALQEAHGLIKDLQTRVAALES